MLENKLEGKLKIDTFSFPVAALILYGILKHLRGSLLPVPVVELLQRLFEYLGQLLSFPLRRKVEGVSNGKNKAVIRLDSGNGRPFKRRLCTGKNKKSAFLRLHYFVLHLCA